MSDFVAVVITGPARAQRPAKLGAKYLVPLNPHPSLEWIAAFDSRGWDLLAMREQPPRVVSYGAQNERVGIGLSSRVVEAPSTTISVLMDTLEAAVEAVNEQIAAAVVEKTATDEQERAQASQLKADVEARIAADWSERQRRS